MYHLQFFISDHTGICSLPGNDTVVRAATEYSLDNNTKMFIIFTYYHKSMSCKKFTFSALNSHENYPVPMLEFRSRKSAMQRTELVNGTGSCNAQLFCMLCRYVRRMRRMNLTGKHAGSVAPAVTGPEIPGLGNVGQSNLLSWAGTFGQGLTSLTKGQSPCCVTQGVGCAMLVH